MSSENQQSVDLNHEEAMINGVRLHWVEMGSGPLVILLHGFPEFWYSWRYQIPALVKAGFQVIALDMRGYNKSDKPIGIKNYCIETITDDVYGVVQHKGFKSAIVVGHDWGGVIAWKLAMREPHAVEKLIILNAPHPAAFLRELRTLSQLRRSWYIFFFQIPWLPEKILCIGDYAWIDRILRNDPIRAGTFNDDDIKFYKQAIAEPGALTAAINYYRALFRYNLSRRTRNIKQIDIPTLLIWGEQDRYLGISLTEQLDQWVPNIQVERIPNASHWVQMDNPERVNQLMIDFLH